MYTYIHSLPIFCTKSNLIFFSCFKSTSNRKEQEVMCIVNFSTDTVDTDHPQFCFCFLSYLIDVQNLWISSHGPQNSLGGEKPLLLA